MDFNLVEILTLSLTVYENKSTISLILVMLVKGPVYELELHLAVRL